MSKKVVFAVYSPPARSSELDEKGASLAVKFASSPEETYTRPMHRPSLALAGALLFALGNCGWGSFIAPELAPVDRLVANGEAYLRLHPKEAMAHFRLARVHYLALCIGRSKLLANSTSAEEGSHVADPEVYDLVQRYRRTDPEEKLITARSKSIHAVQALYGFKEARRIEPNEPAITLGYACFLRAVLEQKANLPDLPTTLKQVDVATVREEFVTAMRQASVKDNKVLTMPLSGPRELVSYEAATNLVELAKSYPHSKSHNADLLRAKAIIERSEKLPWQAITPIVFSLVPRSRLADHLAPKSSVDFDLRGYGFRERWPWVKPELGFLVWDPQDTGNITSARQLFGSYTFELFWKDGYEALSSLDDDGNGALTGNELRGMSVWFDRNGDGKSSREEVIPLKKLSVTSIATMATKCDDIHPMNDRGISFEDGRTLPTWDWIAAPRAPENFNNVP